MCVTNDNGEFKIKYFDMLNLNFGTNEKSGLFWIFLSVWSLSTPEIIFWLFTNFQFVLLTGFGLNSSMTATFIGSLDNLWTVGSFIYSCIQELWTKYLVYVRDSA
jgi:hypothetical protein